MTRPPKPKRASDPLVLRAALVRLLWDSVVDNAECTCCPTDLCPQCQAWNALYGKDWPGAKRAERKLSKEGSHED